MKRTWIGVAFVGAVLTSWGMTDPTVRLAAGTEGRGSILDSGFGIEDTDWRLEIARDIHSGFRILD